MNEAFLMASRRRAGGCEAASERVRARLADMEAIFRDRVRRDGATDMDEGAYGALMNGGKRLRPMLLCLAAGFGVEEYRGAAELMAVVEMIHTASLVHDDIVDGSRRRRGKPTVNAVKGGRFAAQNAYYIIAEALAILKDHRGRGIYGILAGIPMDMCLGELRQLRVEYELSLQTADDYLERIERKTARLIEGACLVGARAAGLCAEYEKALGEYGHALGMLFQLRDDLLDYEGAAADGKPAFQDVSRGIYTLPLLHAVREAFDQRFAALIEKREKTAEDLLNIRRWVRESGGLAYTKEIMSDFAGRAMASRGPLPETGERAAMEELVLLLTGSSWIEPDADNGI